MNVAVVVGAKEMVTNETANIVTDVRMNSFGDQNDEKERNLFVFMLRAKQAVCLLVSSRFFVNFLPLFPLTATLTWRWPTVTLFC